MLTPWRVTQSKKQRFAYDPAPHYTITTNPLQKLLVAYINAPMMEGYRDAPTERVLGPDYPTGI